MDLFRTVIDGPYALLLILQILVVAGLLLTLLWLFIYRAKESEMSDFGAFATEGGGHDVHSHSPSHAQPTQMAAPAHAAAFSANPGSHLDESPDKPVILAGDANGLMDLTGATLGDFQGVGPAMGLLTPEERAAAAGQSHAPGDGIFAVQENPNTASAARAEAAAAAAAATAAAEAAAAAKVRAEVSAADADLLNSARAESDELRSKLEYLEGKLLEYEIVQEEIANLSSLKMENEKLREELVQMQRGGKRPPSGAGSGEGGGGSTPDNSAAEKAEADARAAAEAARAAALAAAAAAVLTSPPRRASTDTSSIEPAMPLSSTPGQGSDFPLEPLPNNVLQLPIPGKEPSLGNVKEVVEAFQDPKINVQLESILSKLEQLTNK